MRLIQRIAGLSVGLALSSTLFAAPHGAAVEQIQLTQCLAAKLSAEYQVLAEDKQFKIIEVPSTQLEKLIKVADGAHCGRFVNVSHQFEQGEKSAQARLLLKKPSLIRNTELPEAFEIRHPDAVKTALVEVQPDNIWRVLSHLTAYENRSATTDTGVETANWIKAEFERMATESGPTYNHN